MLNKLFPLEVPETIPKSMQQAINKLKKAKSQQECLEAAYTIMTTRYYGSRILTYTLFWRLFWPIEKMWQHKGFLQCTGQNYVLRTLLVKSGKFTAQEVVPTWTVCLGISPHQYLRVKIGKKWLTIDPWALRGWGLPFGQHAGR